MSDSIRINPNSQLVILHTSIKGVETRSELVRDEREEGTHETERNVVRTVRDEAEHKEAKRLESLARAAIKANVVHTPVGNITDPKRVESIRARLGGVRERIVEHNAKAKHHTFYMDLLVLPIAPAMGVETQKALCDEVTAQLEVVKTLLRAGDVDGVSRWRHRNRNLDALMPEVIAGALRVSLDVVAEAHHQLKLRVGKGERPEQVGPTLDLSQLEVAASLILPAQPDPTRTEAA